ncbi:MAG: haloacid dehalogenase type II [Hyphomicrobium sp.]|nr:haloacid dehalogenase type II [Methyloceanibacter sp.]MDX2317533.1 haloacid dehalogenase type II [Hyphomicrobiaceae bacterium]
MPRDTVLFDINETVLDLRSLGPKFAAALGDPAVVSTWFAMLLHTSTVCALTGVNTGFADLAGVMLDRIAALHDRTISDDARAGILGGFASLKPHADVKPALERLRSSGYRTVAFSNSSLNLVTKQIANAGLAENFDAVVSVEETGSFKPDGKVYQFVAERLDRPVGDLRLIATHDWDTHGAMVAGMHAAYIDRSGAPYHPLYRRPEIHATTMGGVVEQVIAADTGRQ